MAKAMVDVPLAFELAVEVLVKLSGLDSCSLARYC